MNGVRPSQTPRGSRWLQNFRASERAYAELLIDSLQIASSPEIDRGLAGFLPSLRSRSAFETPGLLLPALDVRDVRKHAGLPPQSNVVAYDNFEPGDPVTWTRGSEALIGVTLRDIVGEDPTETGADWLHPHSALNSLRVSRCRSLVLCTDYCGTGHQVLRYARSFMRNRTLRSWRSFGWLKVYVVAYAASTSALAKIRASGDVDDAWAVTQAPSFSDAQWTPEERTQILDLCARLSGSGNRKGLGYQGSSGLYASDVRVPNNVPEVLRRTGPHWNPFFEGRHLPLELAREISGYRPARDLSGVARELRENRLAEALFSNKRRTGSAQAVMLLALLAADRSSEFELASKLGIDIPEVEELLAALVAADFIDGIHRVTSAGHRELRHARMKRRVTTANLRGVDAPYYPSTLR